MPETTLPNATFLRRRRQLMKQLPAGSIVVIPGAEEMPRNNDVDFPFRQHSDFLYLTGFNEPDALLVLAPGREDGESVLFCRPRDRTMEVWNGYRLGPDGAVNQLGLDQAFAVDEVDDTLPELLDGCRQLYLPLAEDPEFDGRVGHWMSLARRRRPRSPSTPTAWCDVRALIHEARLFKEPEEVEMMRRAAEISARAHIRAWQAAAAATHEYQLEATIRHACAWEGAVEFAYPAIVGSGANACVLHYTENSAPLNAGDLVLIDAGCELAGYASDITRTFPVSGRFSAEQRALYDLVLKAQRAALAAVKPGVSVRRPHEVVVEVLTAGLVSLGLLEGDVAALIDEEAWRRYFMHGTSHWLGLDVHDCGRYQVDGEWRTLQPGMCLTIEPGLYIAPDDDRADARWRGIGIRIEDDVVVTQTGHDNLSASVPTDPDEIERLMREPL